MRQEKKTQIETRFVLKALARHCYMPATFFSVVTFRWATIEFKLRWGIKDIKLAQKYKTTKCVAVLVMGIIANIYNKNLIFTCIYLLYTKG